MTELQASAFPGLLKTFNGASRAEISEAEKKLNMKFASDCSEYVAKFGAISYYEHELTGVCQAKLLDVVSITLMEREFQEVPEGWYVIEQAHIDGIVFGQD